MRSIDLTSPAFTYDDTDPEGFRSGLMRTGPALGATQTGVSVYELPPGQAVCPYHYECGEEEWAMPLDGVVTLRDPDGEHQLKPMQLVFFPRGAEGAHQLRNDGDGVVRLLMFGAVLGITTSVYPDSAKIGVWTGDTAVDGLFRHASAVPYYTDEPRRAAR